MTTLRVLCATVSILAAALPTRAAAAQAAPATDVFYAPLSVGADGRMAVGRAVNATARAGYDNQPAFTRDGRAILFTSIREDAQADIYRYDLGTRTITPVTATPESEYSATPLADGTAFSAVQVEADSTQRLWRIALASGPSPSVLLPAVKPVGYHAWVDDSTLAMFVLGDPATLQVAGVRSAGATTYARDIGRGLQPVPGVRGFVFVQRDGEDMYLEEIRFIGGGAGSGTFAQRRLARTLKGQDFFAIAPSGELLAASGTALYRWSRDCRTNDGWEKVAELGPGVRNVTRLAVSPDGKWLAFVGVPVAR